MNSEDKTRKSAATMKLVLAPGAADASEGTVCLDEDSASCCKEVAGDSSPCEKSNIEYKNYAEKQPGEGFWSITPGCGDISEGMVWVAVIQKTKQ
jgi:hypothetical protein